MCLAIGSGNRDCVQLRVASFGPTPIRSRKCSGLGVVASLGGAVMAFPFRPASRLHKAPLAIRHYHGVAILIREGA